MFCCVFIYDLLQQHFLEKKEKKGGDGVDVGHWLCYADIKYDIFLGEFFFFGEYIKYDMMHCKIRIACLQLIECAVNPWLVIFWIYSSHI